jgi:hypothetical protein
LASDGEYIYNSWLVNGFKTARGAKVQNWKAAIKVWQLAGYFPSQKKSPVKFHDAERERQAAHFERIKRDGQR